MPDNSFKVQQIDHVEVFVPDRYEAAQWYEHVLGLSILKAMEFWAEDPRGPLMISSDDGNTKLALFTGEGQGDRPTAGYHLVAFRVDGPGFLQFLTRIETVDVYNAEGERVTAANVRDHDKAFSIYFADPYGHRLEVTTYDYDFVAGRLQSV